MRESAMTPALLVVDMAFWSYATSVTRAIIFTARNWIGFQMESGFVGRVMDGAIDARTAETRSSVRFAM